MLIMEGAPHLHKLLPDCEAAEGYIEMSAGLASKLDANDVLYSVDSSRDYDPEKSLREVKTPVFALNFTDDEFNSDSLHILQTLIAQVPHARYVVQEGTPDSNGHFSMAHPHLWAPHVEEFMRFAAENAISTNSTGGRQ